MAVRHLHYLQLSPQVRRKAAQSARERLANIVNMNPFLTPQQMVSVQAQLKQLSDWENGCMKEDEPPTPPTAEKPLALVTKTDEMAVGDRETPIVDMSHLASLIKKPPH